MLTADDDSIGFQQQSQLHHASIPKCHGARRPQISYFDYAEAVSLRLKMEASHPAGSFCTHYGWTFSTEEAD